MLVSVWSSRGAIVAHDIVCGKTTYWLTVCTGDTSQRGAICTTAHTCTCKAAIKHFKAIYARILGVVWLPFQKGRKLQASPEGVSSSSCCYKSLLFHSHRPK